ncbi:hypothetical protein FQZ97_1092090 [compost metagenome]
MGRHAQAEVLHGQLLSCLFQNSHQRLQRHRSFRLFQNLRVDPDTFEQRFRIAAVLARGLVEPRQGAGANLQGRGHMDVTKC